MVHLFVMLGLFRKLGTLACVGFETGASTWMGLPTTDCTSATGVKSHIKITRNLLHKTPQASLKAKLQRAQEEHSTSTTCAEARLSLHENSSARQTASDDGSFWTTLAPDGWEAAVMKVCNCIPAVTITHRWQYHQRLATLMNYFRGIFFRSN